MLRKAIKYCKPEAKRIWLMIILKAVNMYLTIQQPLLFSQIVDNVLVGNRSMTMHSFVFFVAIQIVNIINTYCIKTIDVIVSKNTNYYVKTEINRYIFETPTYCQTNSQGKLHSLIMYDSKAVYSFLSVMISTAFTILTVISVGIITITTDFRLTLILLVPYPLVIVINWCFRSTIKGKTTTVLTQNDTLINILKKTLSHVATVQNECGAQIIEKAINREADAGRYAAIDHGKTQTRFQFLVGITGVLGNIIFTATGVILVFGGYISLGKFVAFSSYSKNLSSSIDGLLNLKTNIQPIFVSLERIFTVENCYNEAIYLEQGKKELDDPIYSVELKNVGVSYGQRAILKNVSVKMQQGKIVGITGANGSGKTTLSLLLARIICPQSGEMLINGSLVDSFSYFSYIEHIAYIGTSKVLYPISIKDNLLFSSNKEDNYFENICQLIGITDFVRCLENGYDTVVDDAIKLSAGQIQKIQLARALLKKCDVLVLDEALSNLDESTKRVIVQELQELAKKKIVILISHGQEDYALCESVYRLNHGILEQIK